jgi:dCMP deaminase
MGEQWWIEQANYPSEELLNRQRRHVGRTPLEWDLYYMHLAWAVSLGTKCASRQIGVVIVGTDNRIVSTGYNGAPPGVDLCQDITAPCPRKVLGYGSGEGVHLCPATHAETNAIASAAMMGHKTQGGTIYCWCCMPCVNCTGVIISSGIKRVVHLREPVYHDLSSYMFQQAGVAVDCYDAADIHRWLSATNELHNAAKGGVS